MKNKEIYGRLKGVFKRNRVKVDPDQYAFDYGDLEKEGVDRRVDGVGFVENAKRVIEEIERSGHGLEFVERLPVQGRNETYTHPTEMNFVPYDEAVEVFRGLGAARSEVARVFIVLQFAIYYSNKRDVNWSELEDFIVEVVLDTSPLVSSCVACLMRNIKISPVVSWRISVKLFQCGERFDRFLAAETRDDEILSREEKVNCILHSHKNMDSLLAPMHAVSMIQTCVPKTPEQYKYLQVLLGKLNKVSETNEISQLLHVSWAEPIRRYLSHYSYLAGGTGRPLEHKKDFVMPSENTNPPTSDAHDRALELIIAHVIRADSFLKQDLLSKTNSENTTDRVNEMKKVIFRLAKVSKKFHQCLGNVLVRNCNWQSRIANKLLANQINYDRPLCLLKSLPTQIRYDAVIRTTPYHYVNTVFGNIHSLTIVGDIVKWKQDSSISEEREDKKYDITDKIYVTYPPLSSMVNLKKLTVVGRAYKISNQMSETGGLFLIKYIIASTSCQLEEFTIYNQLSIGNPELDLEILKLLIETHPTLHTIHLKYYNTLKTIADMVTIFEYLSTHSDRVKVLIYSNSEFSGSVSHEKTLKEFSFLKLIVQDSDGEDDLQDHQDEAEEEEEKEGEQEEEVQEEQEDNSLTSYVSNCIVI